MNRISPPDVSQTTATGAHAVVSAYFDALDRGDLNALRASFAPGATWDMPGYLPVSGTYTGADEILDVFLASMLERLDPEAPVGRELTALHAAGDVAIAEWTASASARDGRPYENRYCGVFETAGGRITAVREYTDTQRIEAVLFGGPRKP
jgi:ketosteroid isomerase-like protein